MPWAMTAHVVYTALDKDNPATTSERVIRDTIRGALGFGGVLVSDDIGMKALSGSLAERAAAALAAGCDLVLHCSGDMAEMKDTATGVVPLTGDAMARLAKGEVMREAGREAGGQAGADWDAAATRARLDDILEAPL
jgi:beta-N-acetylhexosaminidase